MTHLLTLTLSLSLNMYPHPNTRTDVIPLYIHINTCYLLSIYTRTDAILPSYIPYPSFIPSLHTYPTTSYISSLHIPYHRYRVHRDTPSDPESKAALPLYPTHLMPPPYTPSHYAYPTTGIGCIVTRLLTPTPKQPSNYTLPILCPPPFICPPLVPN